MRKHGIELRVSANGATASDTAPAEAAAWAVFEDAGVNPWDAAWASFKFEGAMEFDSFGGPLALTDEDCALRDVWLAAIEQAATTFFGTKDYGLRRYRSGFDFELVREPAEGAEPT